MPQRIVDQCVKWAKDYKTEPLNIGVFGLTFKENVPDTRNSKVTEIIDSLRNHNHNVYCIDPFADAVSQPHFPRTDGLRSFGDYLESLNIPALDIAILAVKHDHFLAKGWDLFTNFLNPEKNLVIDVKGILDHKNKPMVTTIWSL